MSLCSAADQPSQVAWLCRHHMRFAAHVPGMQHAPLLIRGLQECINHPRLVH